MSKLLLKKHKEILATQSASKTLSEWVDYFDNQYTKNQIYSYCYRNHYAILNQAEQKRQQAKSTKQYHINQDYFKTWSCNMSYVFGLWCADGGVYGGKIFDITLSVKDKYLLKKIAEELAYEGPLCDYVDRQAARLNFSCEEIYKDIIALGGTEQKHGMLRFPYIPQKYLKDFIRGYFDGKGIVRDIKGMRINICFCCDSKIFLESLLAVLKAEAEVQGGSFDNAHSLLKFGSKDSIKIYNYMYKNNPELFLLRKQKRFSKYL